MSSQETSKMIADIGTLTLDDLRKFLLVAKEKIQVYIDILSESTADAHRSEEEARSTIALYERFPAEHQEEHKQLLDSLVGILDRLVVCRADGEKQLHEFIAESVNIERACIKQIEELIANDETGRYI
ncbi:hypothetical protein BOTCAL_1538g00010 [Botryotinia calthae]|uniref:Uncharacterized protein n=1 Tax=Botryotinia calthae TaxID=38488 RepID=A0A4Y8CC07_9HELO|nr:hypothetical protein BOTCAL_1538g00010 [Botryotinia calthae]